MLSLHLSSFFWAILLCGNLQGNDCKVLDYTRMSMDCTACTNAGAYFVRIADWNLQMCLPKPNVVRAAMNAIVEPYSPEVCPPDLSVSGHANSPSKALDVLPSLSGWALVKIPVLKQTIPDHQDEQDYLVMRKLENVNEQLAKITKRQNETDKKLTAIISKVLPFISNATVLPMEKEIDITNDSGVTQDTLPSESTILDEGKTTTSSLPYILPTTETETAEPITIELTSAPIPSDVRKELRDSFSQAESPLILDAMTLPQGRGGIVFEGSDKSPRRRRFWVIEKAGKVKFTLEENKLQRDSRLTITGFYNFGSTDSEVYIDSSTVTGTEFTVSGVVILVTMTCTSDAGSTSSFAMRILRSRNDTAFPPVRILYPTSFVTGEGRQIASFPENNTVNYENNANHLMVISRESGAHFNLTLTFLDTEEIQDFINVFGVEDGAKRTRIMWIGEESDRHGRGNWPLGRHSTSTAVLFFYSDSSATGKGYELKIE